MRVGGGTDALRDHLFELRKKGFNRLYQKAQVFEFSTPESLLDIDFSQPLFILVDRFVISPDLHQRIVDTTEICYREAGEVIFEEATPQNPPPAILKFSEKFACKRCGIELLTPEPGLFSFNNPMGACPRCQGFGNTIDYDMDLVIPNPGLSLDEGAIDPWTKPQYERFAERFKKNSRGKVRIECALRRSCSRRASLGGEGYPRFIRRSGDQEVQGPRPRLSEPLSRLRALPGLQRRPPARRRAERSDRRPDHRRLWRSSISSRRTSFSNRSNSSPEESAIADKILVEIRQRLKFLNDVGLDYLTLDRLSSTLSGGEAQRIQLATCLGSRLVGACYVLDEPSIGLHSRDTGRLIRILEELRDLGNTIVVVEHDADVMRAADHIIDMGPGAGELGGKIVFEGSYRKIMANGSATLTSKYLRGDLHAESVGERREIDPRKTVKFFGARAHNLEGHRCRNSAEHDGRGDGRFRIRQIDAGARCDLSIPDAAPS